MRRKRESNPQLIVSEASAVTTQPRQLLFRCTKTKYCLESVYSTGQRSGLMQLVTCQEQCGTSRNGGCFKRSGESNPSIERGLRPGVLTFVVTLAVQLEPVQVNSVPSKNSGQELVVGDVLGGSD